MKIVNRKLYDEELQQALADLPLDKDNFVPEVASVVITGSSYIAHIYHLN